MRKNDEAWEKLFKDFDIINEVENNGFFFISANDIKKYREPRLMTKFDSKSALPSIFSKNSLSILPNSRGTYVIGKFEAYAELEYEELSPESVSIPDYIQTFNEFNVTSEAVALNVAQMTGMIDKVLDNSLEQYPAVATITGRLKSGEIAYTIPLRGGEGKFDFTVNNSQVEIDAGFETFDKLAVIEAKSFIPKDFMVRQLYYPYRLFQKLDLDKKVLPIYFTHADGIYAFHIFDFVDENNYGSLKKIKQLNYIVDEYLDISMDDIMNISDRGGNLIVDSAPFPQADNFTRVLDLMRRINHPMTKEKIAEMYGFNPRQSDYYANALIFLDLAERTDQPEKSIQLTKLGRQLSKMPNNNTRNVKIIEQILRDKCFNEVFQEFMIKSGDIDNKLIQNIILKNAYNVSSVSTARRRMSTVISWIKWIISVSE